MSLVARNTCAFSREKFSVKMCLFSVFSTLTKYRSDAKRAVLETATCVSIVLMISIAFFSDSVKPHGTLGQRWA